jgi:hypothetical protein
LNASLVASATSQARVRPEIQSGKISSFIFAWVPECLPANAMPENLMPDRQYFAQLTPRTFPRVLTSYQQIACSQYLKSF